MVVERLRAVVAEQLRAAGAGEQVYHARLVGDGELVRELQAPAPPAPSPLARLPSAACAACAGAPHENRRAVGRVLSERCGSLRRRRGR